MEFEWDESNLRHLARHKVNRQEFEQAIANDPILLTSATKAVKNAGTPWVPPGPYVFSSWYSLTGASASARLRPGARAANCVKPGSARKST